MSETRSTEARAGAAARPVRPASHNQTVGARGEAIAAAYLEGLGYRVLDRNWHSRYGELDLVVVDPGGTDAGADGGVSLVAVEVKTRTGLGYGHPLQAITQRKADRLRRLLLDWCRSSEANATGLVDDAGRPTRPWWELLRVDAIGIVLRPGVSPRIEHLRGIS